MKTTDKPCAAAERAAIHSSHNPSDGYGMAEAIHSEFSALIEAADKLCSASTENEMMTRSILLRAALAKVKGENEHPTI